MDGKLLILCDEIPGDYDHYSIKDIYFLRKELIDPDDNPDRIFVCWDSIIPEDRSFIEMCKQSAATYQPIPPQFMLSQTGKIDPKYGTIKGSLQEESFLKSLNSNVERVRAAAERGEDYYAEAIDLAAQYPFQTTEVFLRDLSQMLNHNGIIRVLPTHKDTADPELIRYRTSLLEAWQNQNKFMDSEASPAQILDGMIYHEFGEVYSRSSDEIMKIYSLPIL